MSSATEVRRAAEQLEANASWFAAGAARHGSLADGSTRAATRLEEVWRAPVVAAIATELERVAVRHRAGCGAAEASAALLRALAGEASATADRLAGLEREVAHVLASLAAARVAVTVPLGEVDPAAARRVQDLDQRSRELARQLAAVRASWAEACRRAGAQLGPLLEPLRHAEREEQRAAEDFAREHLDGVPGRRSPIDRSDPWFLALVEARRADPFGAPEAVLRAAATAFAEPHRATVHDLLEPGLFGRGPGRDDLADLQRLAERLPGPVLDVLIADLDDEQLRRMADAVGGGSFLRRWDAARRHGFWTALTSRVSLEQVRRIAAFTEDLDPTIATAMDDAARGESESRAWFEALVYATFDGPLFAAGDGQPDRVDPSDLTQGRIGNCYLIAAMIGAAGHDPGALRRMVASNPNGTYTVTFPDGMRVTVDPTFPRHPDEDRPAFTNRALREGDRDVDGGYELWPMILEKAYAQRHGGWDEIVGGRTGDAVQELVGGELTNLDPTEADVDELRTHLDAGRVVSIGTHPPERTDAPELYDDGWLAGRHAYVIESIGRGGEVHLLNPWDPNRPPVILTEDELRQVARRLQINELP